MYRNASGIDGIREIYMNDSCLGMAWVCSCKIPQVLLHHLLRDGGRIIYVDLYEYILHMNFAFLYLNLSL